MSDAAREISLPQHLWDSLETMAKEMGVGRDSLVSQAVFTLARLNGYVVPGKVVLGNGVAASAASPSSVAVPASATPAPAAASKVAPAAAKPAPAPVPTPAPQPAPVRGKGKPAPAPEPEPEPEVPEEDQGNPFEEPQGEEEAPAEDEDAPPEEEAAADEEAPAEDEAPAEEEEPAPAPKKGGGGGGGNLTVVMAGREPFKLTADSMLVGRGKHCDFVIESNRVSREHARISREGADFVLEDLNSSNGTFFGPGKEKVTRARKIKDGDEFTFGTEKVKLRIGR